MSIESQIKELHNELPPTVKLVAVSKFMPVEDILSAYNAGQRFFGENRPQELAAKATELPSDIEWHFIGHLQSNKLKMVVPYASMIESVDSAKLLGEINAFAGKLGKKVDCLIEIHIASEDTKQGFSPEEALSLKVGDYPNIRFRGVMGMATFTDDSQRVRDEFNSLHKVFEQMKERVAEGLSEFDQISMGMSHDYKLAISEGATIIRLGSSIFGERKRG